MSRINLELIPLLYPFSVRDVESIDPVFYFGERVVLVDDESMTGTITGMVYRYSEKPKAVYAWWEYIVLWDNQNGVSLRVNVGADDIGFETADTIVSIGEGYE